MPRNPGLEDTIPLGLPQRLRLAFAQHEALDVQSINDGVAGGGHNFMCLMKNFSSRRNLSLDLAILRRHNVGTIFLPTGLRLDNKGTHDLCE